MGRDGSESGWRSHREIRRIGIREEDKEGRDMIPVLTSHNSHLRPHGQQADFQFSRLWTRVRGSGMRTVHSSDNDASWQCEGKAKKAKTRTRARVCCSVQCRSGHNAPEHFHSGLLVVLLANPFGCLGLDLATSEWRDDPGTRAVRLKWKLEELRAGLEV